MYSAPAVIFPVGHSRVQAFVLSLFWISGLIAVGYWLVLFNRSLGWMVGVAVLLLATGFAAACHWWRSWLGTLRWDRQKWEFLASQGGSVGNQTLTFISVLLDFQFVLLVRFETTGGKGVTFWLDRSVARATWSAVRRALYARPREISKKSLAKKPMSQENSA